MTVVEFIREEFLKKISDGNYKNSFDEIIEQAKEMERQQIIESARYYFHERGKLTPEQYYNETFKQS